MWTERRTRNAHTSSPCWHIGARRRDRGWLLFSSGAAVEGLYLVCHVVVVALRKIKQQTNNRIDCIDAHTSSNRSARALASEPSFTRKYTCSLVFVCCNFLLFFFSRLECLHCCSFNAHTHHRQMQTKCCPQGSHATDEVYWEKAWKKLFRIKNESTESKHMYNFVRSLFLKKSISVIRWNVEIGSCLRIRCRFYIFPFDTTWCALVMCNNTAITWCAPVKCDEVLWHINTLPLDAPVLELFSVAQYSLL